MEIVTHSLTSGFIFELDQLDSKSTVTSKLVLHLEDESLTYSIVSVPPYEKEIQTSSVDANSFIESEKKIIFFARVDGKFAGLIKLVSWWNEFAYVDELVVNPEFRRLGVGRALMDRAIEWSRARGFPGIMLETQNDNVPACKLYESCAFILSGFDQNLYRATVPDRNPIALYWYLIFQE
jgi:streptothricin acetyltransferase